MRETELTPDNLPKVQDVDDWWQTIESVQMNARTLEKNKIISATMTHPAHTVFDMLRTRLMQALTEHNWTSIAITAPTRGCGISFVAANLAISMSRLEDCKTVLLDLDLRAPNVGQMMGIAGKGEMCDYLSGSLEPREFLVRVRENLAVGLSTLPNDRAAEIFQATMTTDVLDEMKDLLCPKVVIYVLPPALNHDDVLAFLPNVDAVLLVAGAGVSMADDILKVRMFLPETKPVLGVVLNKADGFVAL